MSNKPILTVSAGGGVKASVWKNNNSADGSDFYSVTLNRSYEKDGEWNETQSFRRDDLPKLEYALNKAYEFILSQQYEVNTDHEQGTHASRVSRGQESQARG